MKELSSNVDFQLWELNEVKVDKKHTYFFNDSLNKFYVVFAISLIIMINWINKRKCRYFTRYFQKNIYFFSTAEFNFQKASPKFKLKYSAVKTSIAQVSNFEMYPCTFKIVPYPIGLRANRFILGEKGKILKGTEHL